MEQALRAGLVGCGSLSQRGILPHLSLPDARERVRLVAVCSRTEWRARACAERFGVPASFARLEDMLEAVDLDMVIVASPVQYHCAHALAAISAGKHVYVQKTMTATLADADALLAARDRAGVKLAAAPGYELCTTTQALRQIVSAGVLGRVYVAYAYTLGFDGGGFGAGDESATEGGDPVAAVDPTWIYQAGGGGPVPNITVYALHLLTSVLGPVRGVTALANRFVAARRWAGRSIPVEIDDNALLLLEFGSGTLATAVGTRGQASSGTPWGSLSLHGDAGALEVTEVHLASGYPLRFAVQGGVWESGTAPARSAGMHEYAVALSDQPYLCGEHLALDEPHVYADIMDLADAIRENRPPRATGEQARHVVEIIEKAQMAARTGQTQQLTSTWEVPLA